MSSLLCHRARPVQFLFVWNMIRYLVRYNKNIAIGAILTGVRTSGSNPPTARRGGPVELSEVTVLLLWHASYDHGPAQA
jgi:hypothetical protein